MRRVNHSTSQWFFKGEYYLIIRIQVGRSQQFSQGLCPLYPPPSYALKDYTANNLTFVRYHKFMYQK